jgi:integrase
MASIHTVQGPNGPRYQVRWRNGVKEHKKTFDRSDKARRFRNEVAKKVDDGSFLDPSRGRITLEAWYREYVPNAPWGPSTRALYGAQAKNHLFPALGSRPLNTITRLDVEKLRDSMQERGVGTPTIHTVHRLLKSLLEAAVKSDRIIRNVAHGVKLGKETPREARFLTAEEVSRLAKAAPERDRVLILFLAYTGLRIGEAAFLRNRHVDLFKRRVIVEGAAKEIEGRRIEGSTKTDRKRSVALPSFLVDELMKHRARFTDESEEAYVFTGPDGAPLRAGNWRKRVWYPACAAAGLEPAPRPHDARHTAATLMLESGYSLFETAQQLGHRSIKMLEQRYGHVEDDRWQALAGRLEATYQASTTLKEAQ